jgi:Ca-activated chloride channel homolog
MTRRPAAVAAAMTALLAAPVLAQQIFRAGIDEVLLSVTVVDGQDHLVPGLSQSDFQVYEDGVLQDISVFSRAPQPIALSILLDTSTSMEPKLDVAQQAAIGFADRLGPHDVAEVIDFNSSAHILQPFTNDRTALDDAIRQTRAGGSTSLYNALYIAFNELKQTRATSTAEIRRQAIVVLSDGEDTSSLETYDDVLDRSKRSDVAVYAIGLRSPGDVPRHGWDEAGFVFRTLTQETGGRLFYVDDVKQLPAVYERIADELASQYTIGYRSKNRQHNGAWRQIVVRTDRPETIARTKAGYYAPGAGQ